VGWLYHRFNLKGLERLLVIMASASQEESLAAVVIPMILLLVETATKSDPLPKSAKKKNCQVSFELLLHDIFNRFIFENRMERRVKTGFLNLL